LSLHNRLLQISTSVDVSKLTDGAFPDLVETALDKSAAVNSMYVHDRISRRPELDQTVY
jgi:hypothetical protein